MTASVHTYRAFVEGLPDWGVVEPVEQRDFIGWLLGLSFPLPEYHVPTPGEQAQIMERGERHGYALVGQWRAARGFVETRSMEEQGAALLGL